MPVLTAQKEPEGTPGLRLILYVESVWDYFNDIVGGLASDIAYYELVQLTETYLNGGDIMHYKEYLEMSFGIEDDGFEAIEKGYKDNLHKWTTFLNGEDNERPQIYE